MLSGNKSSNLTCFSQILRKHQIQDFLSGHLHEIQKLKKHDEDLKDHLNEKLIQKITKNTQIMKQSCESLLRKCLSCQKMIVTLGISIKRQSQHRIQLKKEQAQKKVQREEQNEGLNFLDEQQNQMEVGRRQSSKKDIKKNKILKTRKKPEETKMQRSLPKTKLHQKKNLPKKFTEKTALRLQKNQNTSKIYSYMNFKYQNKTFCFNLLNKKKLCCTACLKTINKSKPQIMDQHIKQSHSQHPQIIRGTVLSFFQHFSSLLHSEQLILRKCGCSTSLFQTDQAYICHINEFHRGCPPRFSSHLVIKRDLQVNPQFDQFLILEQLLIPEVYFCSLCPELRIENEECMIKHIEQKHQICEQGIASSHLII